MLVVISELESGCLNLIVFTKSFQFLQSFTIFGMLVKR